MKKISLFAAIAVAAVGLGACGGSATPAEERAAKARAATGEIVIGAAWPWKARENLLYAQGLHMAVDEINTAGGVGKRRIRLLKVDDQETVDRGRAVAQELAANTDVVAVIGHLQSFITVPAAAIYDIAGVVLLAPTATDPALTEQGYKRVFRTTFTDREVGAHMATVSLSRGYRRMAIYYMRDRYGRSLANAFEETFRTGGGEVIDRQSYDPSAGAANARLIEPLITAWQDRDLDALFIAGEAPQAALVMNAAKKVGLHISVLGGDALGTPELFASGADAVEGVTLVSPFHIDDPRPEVRQFAVAFQRRFGRPPDTAAALAYDAVHVLAAGITHARSTVPDDIAAGLRAMPGWHGVTGTFSFSPAGDLANRPLVTVAAKKGRFAFVPDREARTSGVARVAAR